MKFKATFLSMALKLSACGTEHNDPTPAPTPVYPTLTLAEVPDLLFFNEEKSVVVKKSVCGSNTLFHLSVEDRAVYIMASKVVALDHVFKALERSVDTVIVCEYQNLSSKVLPTLFDEYGTLTQKGI